MDGQFEAPAAEAPQSVEAEQSHETSQVSDQQEDHQGEQPEDHQASPEVSEEKLPFGKHPRWQKMLQENREFQKQVKTYEEQVSGYKGAAEIEGWLKNNPKVYQTILDMKAGRFDPNSVQSAPPPPPEPKVEDFLKGYEGYAPEVQDLAKTAWVAEQRANKIEKRFDEFVNLLQQKEQEYNQQRQHELYSTIDQGFDEHLLKDGLIDEQGNAKNEKTVELVRRATLETLKEMSPNGPTPEAMKKAYKEVMEALNLYGRQALQKTIKTASMPPSGSRAGTPNLAKGPKTDAQRVAELEALL